MKPVNRTVSNFQETIFATISRMASEKGAINLGQGFPDFDGPEWIRELASSSFAGKNQYAPAMGIPNLRESIANYYQSFYGINFDKDKEITVTNGATEAIFCTAMALINPGDEVIVLEPFYDSYQAAIELAGGIPIPVTLHAPEFKFDINELKKAFSLKTKMIFFNSPHNPTGKVFSKEEVQDLCDLVKENDAYLVSDEVYEFLTFESFKHIPPVILDEMRDRTITISSAGKTFGLTGWKIGWVSAAPEITHAIRMVHQFNTFSVCTPLQFAVSAALEKLPEYVPDFNKQYDELRKILKEGLISANFSPLETQGTYFTLIPVPKGQSDIEYCKNLIENEGVATIPLSPFYRKSDEGKGYVRFCFAKKKETIEEAIKRFS